MSPLSGGKFSVRCIPEFWFVFYAVCNKKGLFVSSSFNKFWWDSFSLYAVSLFYHFHFHTCYKTKIKKYIHFANIGNRARARNCIVQKFAT